MSKNLYLLFYIVFFKIYIKLSILNYILLKYYILSFFNTLSNNFYFIIYIYIKSIKINLHVNNSNDANYLHDYRNNNMNLLTFKLTDISDFLV